MHHPKRYNRRRIPNCRRLLFCAAPAPVVLNLRTIKKAAAEIGASMSFLEQLIREGQLTRYKIHRATYISLAEFEQIATPCISKSQITNG